MENNIPRSIYKSYYYKLLGVEDKNSLTVTHELFKKRQIEVLKFYDKINHPNLIKIKPDDIFCFEGICKSTDKFGYFYSDSYHLNDYGSSFISSKIVENIKGLND